jgi:ABC-type uncharacterized transport system permease subunit
MLTEIALTDRFTIALAAIVYLLAFLYGLTSIGLKKPYSRPLVFTLIVVGFILQTIGLNQRGAEIKACPLGNLFEIGQFMAWSLVVLYFIVGPIFQLRTIGIFAAGLAALLSGGTLLVPSWDTPYPPGIFGGNHWIELHAALAIFSYGVFAIVALVSAMYLIQQYGLKKKHFKGIYQYLPSVQQLDTIAYRLLLTGTIVLSASLAFGSFFWIENLNSVPLVKLSMTCLVWAGYLSVVALRTQRRFATKRQAIISIVLFLLALASLGPVDSARANTSAQKPAATDQGDIAP